MRIIDLFCGIGGFRLAFSRLGAVSVFASDIDKFARQTYFLNYGELPSGDISQIESSQIPDHDVLCAGFPCQAFSLAGKSGGFNDTRGTLFFEVARILKEKRPKAFFLENVKGLVSHDKGRTFKTILETLRELDYFVHYKIVNAKDYGVPQNRERIFIIGFSDQDAHVKFKWPEPVQKTVVLGDILEDNVEDKYYLSQQYMNALIGHKERNKNKGNGFGYVVVRPDEIANTIMVGGMGHERNLVQGRTGVRNHLGLRKMTPVEWRRLQGFPEDFVIGVSNAQAYKQFGNSVAVPAIQAVAEQIIKALN